MVKLPAAMSPDLAICVRCADKLKRRGVSKQGASNESDRLLSTHPEAFNAYRPQAKCKRGCGNPVLYDAIGRQPLWCSACERERLRLIRG